MNKYNTDNLAKPELIIILGFLIRATCSFINSFVGSLPGATNDAMAYHDSAVNFSNGMPYFMDTIDQGKALVIILGTLYKIIPANMELFLGGILSCIVWGFSAIFLFRALEFAKVKNSSISIALIIYSFLPFGIIFTSITLRESYQLLLINLILYFIILVLKKEKIQFIFSLLATLIALAFFHKSFIFFTLFITLVLFLKIFMNKLSPYYESHKFFILVIFISGAYVYLPLYTEYYNNIIDLVQSFKFNQIQNARAIYKDQLQVTYEAKYFLSSVVYSFIQFEFEPFPWRETSTVDNVLIVQNLFRMFLFYQIIKRLILSFKTKNLNYIVIFSIFIFLELLWSTGTVNWGTAVRHQIPGYGLFIFLSFINLKKFK